MPSIDIRRHRPLPPLDERVEGLRAFCDEKAPKGHDPDELVVGADRVDLIRGLVATGAFP